MRKFPTLILLAGLATASQAVVLYSTDFESFSLGGLASQGGFDSTSDPNYQVVNTQAFSGSKSVSANTGSFASGGRWAWPNLSPNYNGVTAPALQKILTAQVYLKYTPDTVLTRYGFDVYTAAVARIAIGRVFSNGAVSISNGTTTQTSAAGFVAANTWVQLRLRLDYNTNLITARINGVDTGLSVALTNFTAVNDVDLYTSKDTGSASQGFFDDYRVDAVPEPASLAVIGLGLAAVARRRRS
jgi:hypothetical protein